MGKLIMLKGLPGSGKSTWAKEQVVRSSGTVKRVNKDDLRAMIDANIWNSKSEKMIIKVRDEIITMFLGYGYDVIVDDTNLHKKHEDALRKIAAKYDGDVEFMVNDSFLNVSPLECIERDSKREGRAYVGAKVINRMNEQFLT